MYLKTILYSAVIISLFVFNSNITHAMSGKNTDLSREKAKVLVAVVAQQTQNGTNDMYYDYPGCSSPVSSISELQKMREQTPVPPFTLRSSNSWQH